MGRAPSCSLFVSFLADWGLAADWGLLLAAEAGLSFNRVIRGVEGGAATGLYSFLLLPLGGRFRISLPLTAIPDRIVRVSKM